MDESTPWKNLGIIGLRFIDLVVRYAIIYAIPLALGDKLLWHTSEPWRLLLVVGVPSVLISFVYGLVSALPEGEFRARLTGWLLLPLLPLLPLFLFVPVLFPPLLVAQALFALRVMRFPFLGPSQLRRLAKAAVTKFAGRQNMTQVTTKG
ncbi:hypothetical protein [Streptomyces sp. NPDC001594]|uniref:hypothetical protein n=1 Tax=Streptomyces sp. NPDC001594 TaxID=3364590 RepID=UPI003686918E